jgi:uncharacterized membrane protein
MDPKAPTGVAGERVTCEEGTSSYRRLNEKTRPSRAAVILGAIGLPVLVAGMLTLNVQICLAGAVISAVAVLLHVTLVLAGW